MTSRALTNASTAATSSSSQSTSTQSQSFKAAPTTSNRSTTASTHGVDAEKENFLPPYAPQRGDSESPVKQNDSAVGPSRRPKARLGLAGAANHAPLKTPPKLEGRYKPYVDLEKAESQDILHKARAFDMKIWSIESEYIAFRYVWWILSDLTCLQSSIKCCIACLTLILLQKPTSPESPPQLDKHLRTLHWLCLSTAPSPLSPRCFAPKRLPGLRMNETSQQIGRTITTSTNTRMVSSSSKIQARSTSRATPRSMTSEST